MTDNDTAIVATIQDRDRALTFVIRLMKPLEREQWLIRALSPLVTKADAVETDYLTAGTFLARVGIFGFFATGGEAALLLSDQLLGCCFLMTDEGEKPCTPEYLDAVVENVTTLTALKHTALKHNLAFLLPASGFPLHSLTTEMYYE